MSVVVCVFIHDARLPSYEDWQHALDEERTLLRLDKFSPRDQSGFLPTWLDGVECGFEYSFHPVDAVEIQEDRARIGDRDRVVSFRWHGSQLDARAGVLAAAALAKLTDGVYFDGGDFAQGAEVFPLLERQEAAYRDSQMQLAIKKWGHTTDRRCPKCGAPCPEYKKKCAVCGFEIGRVKTG